MIRSVPVASFVILALIWIGSENLSVFISFLVVVPMIYGATLAGLENMDQKLLEMSQVFSMPFLKKVRYLFIPAWTFSIILISAVFEFVFLTLLKKVRH